SLLRSRQSANESAAVADLRLVETVQVTYASVNGGGFGSISQLVAAGVLYDRVNQTTSGYIFSTTLSAETIVFTLPPPDPSRNDGRYDYYTRPDNIIRYSTDPTRAPSGLSGEPVR